MQKTLTVRELLQQLQDLPPDLPVTLVDIEYRGGLTSVELSPKNDEIYLFGLLKRLGSP